MTRAALILVVAAVVGCGGKQPGRDRVASDAAVASVDAAPAGPPALADDLPTLAARTAEMFEALAAALTGEDPCGTLAERAAAVLAEHRETRAAASQVAERDATRDLDRELDAYADRIAKAGTSMRPALSRCGGDAAFAEALTPFDL